MLGPQKALELGVHPVLSQPQDAAVEMAPADQTSLVCHSSVCRQRASLSLGQAEDWNVPVSQVIRGSRALQLQGALW